MIDLNQFQTYLWQHIYCSAINNLEVHHGLSVPDKCQFQLGSYEIFDKKFMSSTRHSRRHSTRHSTRPRHLNPILVT